MALIKKCMCGSEIFREYKKNGLEMWMCAVCSISHQNVNMTETEYRVFYRYDYQEKHQKLGGYVPYADRYKHDLSIAALRYDQYRDLIPRAARVLDIGSSNGAFVDYMRDKGYKTYGVEYSSNHRWTYSPPLKDLNIGPGSFDLITMHDVLEHLVNPMAEVKLIHAMLKIGGFLVIDFPHFWTEAGRHHWKKIEHLWYFKEHQLISLLRKEKFALLKVDYPIKSKLVVYCYKL